MKKRLLRIVFLSVGLLITVGLIWMGLIYDETQPTPSQSTTEQPFGRMDDFIYTRTEGGKVLSEMKAKEAYFYQQSQVMTFSQLDGKLISPEREIFLTGERGDINLKTKLGKVEGNVVGQSSDGYLLHTPRLQFDAQARRAYTDQAVQVESKNFIVQGVGMELDLVAQTFRLNEGIKASLWQ